MAFVSSFFSENLVEVARNLKNHAIRTGRALYRFVTGMEKLLVEKLQNAVSQRVGYEAMCGERASHAASATEVG